MQAPDTAICPLRCNYARPFFLAKELGRAVIFSAWEQANREKDAEGDRLKQGQEDLLRALLRHDRAATSGELAAELGCSPRSVKTYVKQVNELAGDRVVFSSKDGYLLNRRLALNLLDQQEGAPLPQSHAERSRYIIKRFALEHESTLNIFDLCEELYVSLSTLRSDIRKMNLAYERFDVSFRSQSNELQLIGSEQAKRHLFGYALFEETGMGVVSLKALRESFSAVDIDAVAEALDETMAVSGHHINEISRNNLLMHLLILINRVRSGDSLHGEDGDRAVSEEGDPSRFLCDRLARSFSIELSVSERLEVQMLLKAYTNAIVSQDQRSLARLVGEQLVGEARGIATAISHQYDVNLCTNSFLMPFCLHLKNLIERNHEGIFAKNPLAQTIRKECPLIYDIGTSLAIRIARQYDLRLTEDETAFIALHVGAELERQRLDDSKVRAAVICPDYHDMARRLIEQLELEYSANLEVVAAASDEEDLKDASFDLLVTALPVDETAYARVVHIAPFGHRPELSELSDAISEVRRERELASLERHFRDYFSESLFFPQVSGLTREQVISMLCSRLQELGFADEFFDADVLQREHASNTAFGAMAIPHAASMSANKTCIAVATSVEGIPWGPATVKLVLLFAISDVDKGTFRALYEGMISLLSEPNVADALSEMTSFEAFQDAVMGMTKM